jgi:uncharacterized repeat protein (TIGR02543 family)
MKRRDNMNTKTIRMSALCFLVSLSALFTACEVLGPEPQPDATPVVTAPDGKAVVSVRVETRGRTVAPVVGLEHVKAWKLLGAKQGESAETLLLEFVDVADVTIALEPGEWHFTLEGYKDSSVNGLILGGSIANQTISLEETRTLAFEVAPVLSGAGFIAITINLPNNSGITTAQVFKEGAEYTTINAAGDKVVFEELHEAGVYYFSIRLYKGDDFYGVVSEIVYVCANLKSEAAYTLTEDDLKFVYTITYHLWDGGTEYGYYRRTDATLTLPVPSRFQRPPFLGWYDNEDLSGDAVIQIICADSTGDKDFYAKWTPAVFLDATLAEALAVISANPEDGDAYTIVLNDGDGAVIDPTPLSYGGKKVSITLVGGAEEQTLKLSETKTGSLFTLGDGVTLSLDNNITLEGRSDNTAALVMVNSGGELVMNEGSKISGNKGSLGGGVNVAIGGTFTMTGGEISNNTASSYGGGIFVKGTFNMEGGKISGNTILGANGRSEGGGVHINTGEFNMSGGEVSGNTAIYGGGVYVSQGGTFNMSGKAIISGNTATSNGGGVHVIVRFTMTGGEISHNTAKCGGGVYINGGTFTKEPDGVIYGSGIIYGSDAEPTLQNTATDGDAYGHAVYVSAAMKRNSTVEENEPLSSASSDNWVDHWTVSFDADGGAPVTQTATADSGASLGASMPSDPTRDGYAFGGWYTEQNGGGTPFTAATTVSGAVTVYANWQYTVTFDLDDGTSVTETRTVNSGDPVDAAMPSDPTQDGYAFGGWYTEPEGEGTQFAADTPVIGNIRVYALWLP